jgi:hypothetical protein
MWLPKDERKLLSHYYCQINKAETDQIFELNELLKSLRKNPFVTIKTKREIILENYCIIENVNNLLSQQGLIKWENLNPNSIDVLKLPRTSEALG